MVRVMIVDDHRLVVDALRRMLDQEPDMAVVAVAHDRESAMCSLAEKEIEVAVLDIRLSFSGTEGLEIAEYLYENHPEVKVVILTMSQEGSYIDRMLKSNISGYMLKDGAGQELVTAIRTVHAGGTYYSVDVMKIYTDFCRNRHQRMQKVSITRREKEILQLVVDGLNNRQISDKLNIGEAGVESHRRHIREKLEVGNTAEMVREAILQDLIDLNKYSS